MPPSGEVCRSTDVVKALALGARAVLFGRPYVWELAVAGDAGVRQILRLFEQEFTTALILCGCATMSRVDRQVVRAAGSL